MKVFRLQGDANHYEGLIVPDSYYRGSMRFLGKPLGGSWIPLEVARCSDPDSPPHPPSDFPALSGVPVFSKRAVEAIGDTLVRYGELLPVRYTGGEYHAYNVTHVIDALEVSESRLYYQDDGSVLSLTTPSAQRRSPTRSSSSCHSSFNGTST